VRKVEIFPRYTDDKTYTLSNTTTEDSVSNTDGSGKFTVSRTSSAGFDVYRNGASIQAVTRASVAMQSGAITFLCKSDDSLAFLGIIAAGGVGGGLTAGVEAAAYAADHGFLQAVGAVA
jgi:hypothetical protein